MTTLTGMKTLSQADFNGVWMDINARFLVHNSRFSWFCFFCEAFGKKCFGLWESCLSVVLEKSSRNETNHSSSSWPSFMAQTTCFVLVNGPFVILNMLLTCSCHIMMYLLLMDSRDMICTGCPSHKRLN